MSVPRIYSNNSNLSPSIGKYAIDKAVAGGTPKESLRWRVGPVQLRSIARLLFNVADAGASRYEAEHGPHDSGLFAGVPYVLDAEIADGEIHLERVTKTELVSIVDTLAIPSEDYWNRAEHTA